MLSSTRKYLFKIFMGLHKKNIQLVIPVLLNEIKLKS